MRHGRFVELTHPSIHASIHPSIHLGKFHHDRALFSRTLESWFISGKSSPFMAQQFRLVKYYFIYPDPSTINEGFTWFYSNYRENLWTKWWICRKVKPLQNLDRQPGPIKDQRLPCRCRWMDDLPGPSRVPVGSHGSRPRFYLALGTFTLTENNLAAQGGDFGDWGFHKKNRLKHAQKRTGDHG